MKKVLILFLLLSSYVCSAQAIVDVVANQKTRIDSLRNATAGKASSAQLNAVNSRADSLRSATAAKASTAQLNALNLRADSLRNATAGKASTAQLNAVNLRADSLRGATAGKASSAQLNAVNLRADSLRNATAGKASTAQLNVVNSRADSLRNATANKASQAQLNAVNSRSDSLRDALSNPVTFNFDSVRVGSRSSTGNLRIDPTTNRVYYVVNGIEFTLVASRDSTILFDPMRQGLVHYYYLDESTVGTVNDVISGGINGTNNGATVGLAGQYGTDYGFTGSQFIQFSSSTRLIATQAWSVSAWIKLPSGQAGGNYTVLNVGGGSGGIELRIDDSFHPSIVKAGQTGMGSASSTVTAGARTHVLWTYDGTTGGGGAIRFYINGSPAGSATSLQTFPSTGSDFIGLTENREGFVGEIDEVKIYNRVISPTDAPKTMLKLNP